jgi:hypothetical protein
LHKVVIPVSDIEVTFSIKRHAAPITPPRGQLPAICIQLDDPLIVSILDINVALLIYCDVLQSIQVVLDSLDKIYLSVFFTSANPTSLYRSSSHRFKNSDFRLASRLSGFTC